MNLFSQQAYFQNKFSELHFQFYDKVDSTNEKCKEMCRNDECKNWVVVANAQSRGRGRYGRTWESQAKNIYISFSIKNPFVNDIVTLNFYLGVMLYRAVIHSFPEIEKNLTLKWPNDLYFNDKKLAGILIENVDNELRWIVVGMGINVYASANEIPDIATSLAIEGVREESMRTKVISCLLEEVYTRTTVEDYRELFWKYSGKTQNGVYSYTKGNKIYRGVLQCLHDDGSVTICDVEGQKIHIVV
ncbi:biotin--[acetyl-CoA-carboxylase] ligase [Candidatus Uabimicrobium amorphum]|uniref:Biotin--[acetyl-CoA-carboxylase] ligase n=1 Tax=Uabimicrobium amorphum TaxID=2596890 RepID=A0A5S9ITW6_UABAM|nr:biotin--[acetyl-CoA-carboxylase] ligase [Candidatus Uabimicrobium amorphum]BBM87864.1 biotin--[acetyl-CoA-carboxylase] ligase [Candidatus Uabimicrobium amorphum]